jgi:hypothetical protein
MVNLNKMIPSVVDGDIGEGGMIWKKRKNWTLQVADLSLR